MLYEVITQVVKILTRLTSAGKIPGFFQKRTSLVIAQTRIDFDEDLAGPIHAGSKIFFLVLPVVGGHVFVRDFHLSYNFV